ncbi:hypothetical protein DFH11DRAFT_1860941 [Phellopilus nigrolimitatus]|nr:hypothetical protein DFH11DRAFT_1860941 [Phellopilus nigrolimitatus]
MLIDWDNAALLGSGTPLTDMTGTPMYIAIAVSTGSFTSASVQTRADFPVLEGEARELYIGAYGEDRYRSYIDEVNNSSLFLKHPGKRQFEHLPYLDMESVFWLFAHLLCCACVGNADKPTYEYNHFAEIMERQDPGKTLDRRLGFLYEPGLEEWEGRLHPKLKLVAGMLSEMAWYFNTRWVYWKNDIPADHAHEMMKRLFLDKIVHVRKEGDVTINLKRARERWQDPAECLQFPLD